MAERMSSPRSGAGRRLLEVLTAAIPELKHSTSFEIRFAVDEPISVRIVKAARLLEDFETVAPSVDAKFDLREVDDG
jgi:hypothetical protein